MPDAGCWMEDGGWKIEAKSVNTNQGCSCLMLLLNEP